MATQVVSKFAFKDEGKDVLGDVLKDPVHQATSGDTGAAFEPVPETPPVVPEPSTTPPPTEETPPAPVVSTSTAPPVEKVYAGKFKTPEALEQAYTEAEKRMNAAVQEAATLRKAATRPEVAAEVVAAKTEEDRLKMINEFLTDPAAAEKRITDRVVQQATQSQEVASRVAKHWVTNQDVKPYEKFVGWTVAELVQANPELDPWAALEQATTQIRAGLGAIRDEGKKEALAIQSSVTTASGVKVNTPPPTEQPAKAPMTDQDAATQHLDFLRTEAARVRRPVR